MPRKEKKYHFIYKTTCKVTGRFYVGMHSTDDLEDGYLGSGRRLRYSVRKHGEENHLREILKFCDNRKELIEQEREIVNKQLVESLDCLNMIQGGLGGYNQEYLKLGGIEANKVRRKILSEKRKNDPQFRRDLSDSLKKRWKENGHPWEGRSHSKETKQKMRESAKGKHNGEKNSQYGTCWVCNKDGPKKIKKENLEQYLNVGWRQGRK